MISINWGTREIFVPQSYLTLVSGTIYEMDVEQFRLDLKDLEDSDEGISFPATHARNAPTTLAGVTYAQTLEIINGYTVTFEDTGSHYTVKFTGANHNIADVTNYDAVNLIVGNSAGLILVDGGGGGGSCDWNDLIEGPYSVGDVLRIMAAVLAGKSTIVDNGDGTKTVKFRAIDDSADRVEADIENSERTAVTLNP